MFKDMKLGTKLLVSFLAVGVIPFAVIGITSLMNSSEALEKQAFNQLKAQREIKKGQIESYFAERRGDMGVMLETVAKVQDGAFEKLESIQELKSAQMEQYLDKVKNDITVLAKSQDVQIAFNQLKNYHDYMGFGAEAPYDVSTDQYQGIWKSFEQSLGKYITDFGYYDLFIICKPHGHVMYTYAQEPDLGANLGSGQYQDESLARLWRKVVEEDRIVVEDFSEYAPSDGQQAMFIGGPVTNDQNETIGVVALQVPAERINEIVQQRQGLGSTGETYLAARQEGRIEFRSDLQTMGEGQYVTGYDLTDIAPEYLVQTLDGNPVHDVFLDSAGNPVIVASDLLEVGEGLEWGMVTKINLEEALTGGGQDGEKDYFAKYIEAYGYYDLFLINNKGYVYYTVTKEADYQTNMVDGKYSDSGLGKLTRQVIQTKEFHIADFEPYAPSGNAPCAFMAEPLMAHGEVETVVALQLSLESINHIMQQRAGMGETGEAYLVGSDKLMRSDSYLDPQNHSVAASFANPQQGQVDTEAVRQALAGKTGEQIITDYTGSSVLSAYTPVSVGDTTWALMAEINESEAFASIHTLEWIIGLVAVFGIAAIVLVALLVTRSITKPINRIIAGLSEGAEQVASASGQVSSSSQSMAEGASEQASSLEETSSSLEEMAAQTRQNADNADQADKAVKDSGQMVESGVSSMQRMNTTINEIKESSNETSKIIKTIDEIAFQTNLLALNAAVEAARAGEAGKGFAVVAEEVRNLAQRSAEAAKNTSQLIEKSQENASNGVNVAEEVAKQLGSIQESSTKVNTLIGEIAAASKEQAQGIDQVNTAVSEMDKVVQQNAADSEESASASEELSSQAEELKKMVHELTGLIGGKKGQTEQHAAHQPAKERSTQKKGLPQHKQQKSTGGKAQSRKQSQQKQNSEQVIPLDDSDFEDF